MSPSILLLTPPFTQLNTPYPATTYLKGFLNTRNIPSFQCDLGIEVTLRLFSKSGLTRLFARLREADLTEDYSRMYELRERYCNTIEATVEFLQGKNPTLAHLICSRNLLPEGPRFAQMDDLVHAFGKMGIQDKAKHLATMYLEDLSDLIQQAVDPHFGLSRYAERLGRSAASFDELYTALQQPLSLIDQLTIETLSEKLAVMQPAIAGFSVPFPGNLFSAFRCAQWLKQEHPAVKVVMGGGFPNTELRSLSDPRVFEFFDFITLDDGEAPLENLIHFVQGTKSEAELKRTYLLLNDGVVYRNNQQCSDYRQGQVGTPDYSDLLLDQYISVIEVTNPMHSMWSDGRWNKLTMAHGCYWGKCTFCDTSLPYIAAYEPVAASLLADRMEELIAQTGTTGFHFVDEAAPPALMRALALEIIRRKMVVSWWTNIRFEKAFTRDLCMLLKASGCIAVSGGLEVASDRLLALIQKGITVKQVAQVNQHFTEAGIMVHAYLMYGFPTQTAQETIDSLEMVRQMFAAGILQSAFWHQFAMTAHSPVGLAPEQYQVTIENAEPGSFANNDRVHHDPGGADHESFSFGLKKSLFNYMHGACLDHPLHKWFDFKTPKTTVAAGYITAALADDALPEYKANTKVIFLGTLPAVQYQTKSKKGATWENALLTFYTSSGEMTINLDKEKGNWLCALLPALMLYHEQTWTMQEVKTRYEQADFEDFEMFWFNKPVNQLYKAGLLTV